MRKEAGLSRRQFLGRAAAGAGALVAGGLATACGPTAIAPSAAAPTATPLPLPETTSLRLPGIPTCDAPLWLIEEQLRQEGFTDITFVRDGLITRENVDISSAYANFLITGVDAGFPFTVVAGGHTGCLELWAAPGITSIRDLRGKTIQIFDRIRTFRDRTAAGITYGFLLSVLAHIGVDPTDLKLVDVPDTHDVIKDYLEGRTDAVILLVHQGALMRRNPKRRGSVILDSSVDKPWSQNYCCLLVVHRDWAKANPVATKRVTRAFLRASDIVAADRKAAVDKAIEKGFYRGNPALTPEVLLETIGMLSYDWRDFDPEETLRFYALRLRDAKQIKMTPQQIIDEGSDLAYFRQLRKELKA